MQNMEDIKFLLKLSLALSSGKFPKRALRAVLDWYDLHRKELLQNWKLALKDVPLNKIKPLE